jgi:hypothetical protein
VPEVGIEDNVLGVPKRRPLLDMLMRTGEEPGRDDLTMRTGEEARTEPMSSGYSPDSLAYKMSLGATSQPRIPQPSMESAEAPTMDREFRPPDRVTDDMGGRSGGPNALNATYEDPGRAHLADLMKQQGAMNTPAAPVTLKQRMLGALRGGLAAASPMAKDIYDRRAGVQEKQREEGVAQRQTLAQQIEAEQRAAEQREFQHGEDAMKEGTADKRMTLQQQMEQDRLKQQKELEDQKERWGQDKLDQTLRQQQDTVDQKLQQAAELADKKTSNKPEVGTWQLQRDENGNTVMFNSKTAQVKPAPPGLVPKGEKPSADEQRRADLAGNLNENLDKLEDIVSRRPDLFGPLAGRWASLKGAIGSNDPDIATLKTIQHQIGMAQISAHGMRSAHGIEGAADSIFNNMKNGPEAMKASISAVRNSVKTFQQDVQNARPPAQKLKNLVTPNAGGQTKTGDPLGIL